MRFKKWFHNESSEIVPLDGAQHTHTHTRPLDGAKKQYQLTLFILIDSYFKALTADID